MCLLHEKTITHDARRFFNGKLFSIREGTHVTALDHRRKIETPGGLFDDVGVGVGIRTQFMIEMRDDNVIPRLAQDAHQAETIRSARDSCDHERITVKATLFTQNGLNVLKHRNATIKFDTIPPEHLLYSQDE